MAEEKVSYFAGLDLGPSGKFTGLAIVERRAQGSSDVHYAVRHLARFPPGTPYSALIEAVRKAFAEAKIPKAQLIVDQTAVGPSVCEQFRRASIGGGVIPLTITGGTGSGVFDRGGWVVPKMDLVGVMQLLFQNRQIKVAESLEFAATLMCELQQFQVKTVASSPDMLDWRERPHDDLVFALAIAVWIAERTSLGFCVNVINPDPVEERGWVKTTWGDVWNWWR